MGIFTTLRYIVNHPLNRDSKVKALTTFVKWQVSSKLSPYPVIYSITDRAKLIIKRGMTGATGNLYNGLHEYADMGFLLHFLRKEDLFVDIGANVGVYTVLAGAHVGASVIAAEPVPATYSHLLNNIRVNDIQSKTSALNVAVGAAPGQIDFTSTLDTVNHVATAGEKDTIKVEVNTLDNILAGKTPALLKIDVEGFETDVINGAVNALRNERLKAIIIELNGSGERYGYNEADIHQHLLRDGFKPYQYDPGQRVLNEVSKFGTHNTIYIRDLATVEQRLRTAEKLNVRGRSL